MKETSLLLPSFPTDPACFPASTRTYAHSCAHAHTPTPTLFFPTVLTASNCTLGHLEFPCHGLYYSQKITDRTFPFGEPLLPGPPDAGAPPLSFASPPVVSPGSRHWPLKPQSVRPPKRGGEGSSRTLKTARRTIPPFALRAPRGLSECDVCFCCTCVVPRSCA